MKKVKLTAGAVKTVEVAAAVGAAPVGAVMMGWVPSGHVSGGMA